jgi:hypothetical protein
LDVKLINDIAFDTPELIRFVSHSSTFKAPIEAHILANIDVHVAPSRLFHHQPGCTVHAARLLVVLVSTLSLGVHRWDANHLFLQTSTSPRHDTLAARKGFCLLALATTPRAAFEDVPAGTGKGLELDTYPAPRHCLFSCMPRSPVSSTLWAPTRPTRSSSQDDPSTPRGCPPPQWQRSIQAGQESSKHFVRLRLVGPLWFIQVSPAGLS